MFVTPVDLIVFSGPSSAQHSRVAKHIVGTTWVGAKEDPHFRSTHFKHDAPSDLLLATCICSSIVGHKSQLTTIHSDFLRNFYF